MKKLLLILLILPSIAFGGNDRNAKIDSAIQRGIRYLQTHPEGRTLEIYLAYEFLKRKFQLDALPDFEKTLQETKKNQEDYQKIYPFLRFKDPNTDFNKVDFSVLGRMDNMTATAIWADKMDFNDSIYLNQIEMNLERSFYKRSHAYLSCQLLREHNLPITKSDRFLALESAGKNSLVSYLNNAFNVTDKKMEAAAFLLYTNQAKGVMADDFIDEIMGAQHSHGGWSYDHNHDQIEQHTVIMAIFVLLEYRYPEAKDIPWIVFN